MTELTGDMLEFITLYERCEDMHRKLQALSNTFSLEEQNLLNNRYLKPMT